MNQRVEIVDAHTRKLTKRKPTFDFKRGRQNVTEHTKFFVFQKKSILKGCIEKLSRPFL